jgi:F-type H+-transporting ATPase subunit b
MRKRVLTVALGLGLAVAALPLRAAAQATPTAAEQPAHPAPATTAPTSTAPTSTAPASTTPAVEPAAAGHDASAPGSTAPAAAQPAGGAHPAPTAPAHAPASEHATAGEHGAAEAHEESPWGLVARLFNFAVLVGLLVYFLRGPLGQHLASRRQQIAAELVSARETTERAKQQLSDIDRRLRELPAELEALKARGAEDTAAEGVRIRQQAEAERHRLLEQTRREVEMQVRLAKQSLAEHTADLAVQLAHDRLAATITADDQARLVDRYVSHVKELHG